MMHVFRLRHTRVDRRMSCAGFLCVICALACSLASADEPSAEVLAELQTGLSQLQSAVDELSSKPELRNRNGKQRLADVAIFAKAVEWMLRHREFPKKGYAAQAAAAIKTGQQRASQLNAGTAPWELRTGVSIRGYVSGIDGSVQPYAISLPEGVNPESGDRWPLHIKLHGRANDMNEVNFMSRHEGKPLPNGQTWIQLDVYGRGNNAYRWAGETDVFEALADVRRRFRIDDDRITLHGFSMGGAGAWHLGLHHPAKWSSVGPGAGFVDFYKYQKQTKQRPAWQHATLGVYDAVDYALNAANVPVCTYGGENDAQLLASTTTVDAAKKLGVDIKLLIGPGMGHKFHPESFKEFMAFHQEKSKAGRLKNKARKQIRFTTRTLKYNKCDWITIEEIEKVYEPSTVEAVINERGNAEIKVSNVAVFSVSRDVAEYVDIDGELLECHDAANGLLPNVYYEKTREGWRTQSYEESRAFSANPDRNKRHRLQGPIDDAFMSPFVCVSPNSKSTNKAHAEWAEWTLKRFEMEFDKWMRAKIRIVEVHDQSESMASKSLPILFGDPSSKELIMNQSMLAKNLILFGDPSSNEAIRKVLPDLPLTWTEDEIKVGGKSFSTKNHGLSLIYPNPLQPGKYVVINLGHTFHEADFKNSNSWLFPRLGDIAVQKLTKNAEGGFDEETVWATNFNSGWRLPANKN